LQSSAQAQAPTALCGHEDDATLKDRDVVLELDGRLVELLYSARQRRVA
jgi:hypothetical protein